MHTHFFRFVFLMIATVTLGAACSMSAEISPAKQALLGKWEPERTNKSSIYYRQSFEFFQNDRFTFYDDNPVPKTFRGEYKIVGDDQIEIDVKTVEGMSEESSQQDYIDALEKVWIFKVVGDQLTMTKVVNYLNPPILQYVRVNQ